MKLNVRYDMVKETKRDRYSVGYYVYCILSVIPTALTIVSISFAITMTLAAIHDVAEYGSYSLESYYESQKWFFAGVGTLLIILLIAVAFLKWLAYCVTESDGYFDPNAVQCERCIRELCYGKEQCKEESLQVNLTLHIIGTVICTIVLRVLFGNRPDFHLLKGLFSVLLFSLSGASIGAVSAGIIMVTTKKLCNRKSKC